MTVEPSSIFDAFVEEIGDKEHRLLNRVCDSTAHYVWNAMAGKSETEQRSILSDALAASYSNGWMNAKGNVSY